MNDPLQSSLNAFLQRYYRPSQPVLLALSGGPDSLALFHLLLQYREKYPLSLGIAHVNHNWRPESGTEAKALELLAQQHRLPFHVKEIHPGQLKGNLEAASREERLKFFYELCNMHGYQAVLLGHHGDDQAETVLKRVFEGADLSNLCGLQPFTEVEKVVLWRPLLNASKAEICRWIDSHGLEPFLDKTNLDPRFLRGKMRTQIVPELSKSFGKEISGSLCHLAREVSELREYLSGHVRPYLERIQKGPMGSLLDLSENAPASPFEIKFLLREWCRREDVCLTRDLADTISELLMSGKANRHVTIADTEIHIDRGRLFLTRNKKLSLPTSRVIEEGDFHFGPWHASVTLIDNFVEMKNQRWEAAWNGRLEAVLPAGEFLLGPPRMNASYQGHSTTIGKLWNNHKIPAFLRPLVPVIWCGDIIQHEFLTGRNLAGKSADRWIKITLKSV